MNPKVSIIIIDYKKDNPYLVELFSAITKQSYKNYEVILVTDYKNNLIFPKLSKKHFGKYVGPAEKRDYGAKIASGEILVFIDDDAYPSKNWLKEIVREFKTKEVAAVGGPGITPSGVSWQEESSGWASASPLGSGKYMYRFLPRNRRFVDDFPSMNLSVRKKDFVAVGGFDSNYWPGEDTKFCLDLVSKLKKKIVYNPRAFVYHHRRPVLWPHLRQNGNFGIHRGFFARVLPQTSLKPIYFFPSLLLINVLLVAYNFYLLYPIVIYTVLLFINSFWIYTKSKNIFQSIISIPVIFVTHLWYGFRFLQGLLFTRKLTR